jgi:hypothetical protein
MEVSGQLHTPAALSPEEIAPSSHSIGGWVGSRAGLDPLEENLAPVGNRTPAVQAVAHRYTYWAIIRAVFKDRVLGCLQLRRNEEEPGENCTMRCFVIYTSRQISLEWSNQGRWDGEACSTYGREEKCVRFCRKAKIKRQIGIPSHR